MNKDFGDFRFAIRDSSHFRDEGVPQLKLDGEIADDVSKLKRLDRKSLQETQSTGTAIANLPSAFERTEANVTPYKTYFEPSDMNGAPQISPPTASPLAEGKAMIRLRNLEKSFKTKAGFTYVLRQINLDIAEGEFITIMGPSGAGKSTLLGILGMYDHAWEGEFVFSDQHVHRLNPKQRSLLNKQFVGFVFQQFHLLDDLTVSENLDIPLSYRNIKHSERQALVADALDRFNIVGKKDLFPSQLSGGQQQLVAVARAVIAKPRLLLADEPTGNLHSEQGREIMELFKKLNEQGTTIVQVTHSEANAAYGNRIIKLKDGWLVKD